MVTRPEKQGRWDHAAWATFGDSLFTLGFGLLVLTMLVGKCRPLKAIFEAGFWQPFSKLVPCMNMLGPIVCLWFFLSTASSLNFEFLTELYYFEGNFVFTMIFVLMVGTISDLPIQMVRR
jgi:hypothetical protein